MSSNDSEIYTKGKEEKKKKFLINFMSKDEK